MIEGTPVQQRLMTRPTRGLVDPLFRIRSRSNLAGSSHDPSTKLSPTKHKNGYWTLFRGTDPGLGAQGDTALVVHAFGIRPLTSMDSAPPSATSFDIFKEGLFKDTVWVVTGGGTGIGLEIATQAARLGAHLAICGRRSEPLISASEAIKAIKSDAKVFTKTCTISNTQFKPEIDEISDSNALRLCLV